MTLMLVLYIRQVICTNLYLKSETAANINLNYNGNNDIVTICELQHDKANGIFICSAKTRISLKHPLGLVRSFAVRREKRMFRWAHMIYTILLL